LDCDLLIIDDLGTEMTTQFTVSTLYYIINSRLMDNRATIISTNLMPEAIEKRYSPQIASRVVGSYRLIKFVGEDIRRR
jgi:DNA replication protein DnaC